MNDTLTIRGLTFAIAIEHDDGMSNPWKEHDGHGPVRDIRANTCTGRPEKKAGERVLFFDRGYGHAYDVAGAMVIAKCDGWGVSDSEGMTAGQIAAAAVEADFQRLRAWCNDEWYWCGVVVTLLDAEGDATSITASLWGIESDSEDYLEETAQSLADEIADDIGRKKYIQDGASRTQVRA